MRADLQHLTARVKVVAAVGAASGESLSLSQACELTVPLKDGTTRCMRRDDADGREAAAYARYMNEKFIDCAGQVFDCETASQPFASVAGFDTCSNVAQ